MKVLAMAWANETRTRRRRWAIYGCVALGYGLIMTFGGCADRLILFPTTDPIAVPGASLRMVEHEGGVIEVWTARSPGARQAEPEVFMLEFTGNATRAEHIVTYVASRWGQRAVETWVVNYPGYGGSTGPARLAAIPPAALAVYDELAGVADGRPIVLAGNSLGSTAALHVAANRPATGLILQNPPPLKQLILQRFGWWNLWLAAGPIAMQLPGELDSIINASHVQRRAVFLLARDDELVSPRYQNMVVDAYAGETRVIQVNGGHNDPLEGASESELQAAMAWLISGTE